MADVVDTKMAKLERKAEKFINEANIKGQKDLIQFINPSENARFHHFDVQHFNGMRAEANKSEKNKLYDKNWNAYQEYKTSIRIRCRSADKIIVASHGNMGEPDKFFVKIGKDDNFVTGSINVIGSFLCQFLYPGKVYKIGLYMCYGARSKNYNLDHDELFEDINDLKTSFAYKLTEYLAENAGAEVMLSSRYGTSGTAKKGDDVGVRYSTVEHRNLAVARIRLLDEQFGFERIKSDFDEVDQFMKDNKLNVYQLPADKSEKYFNFKDYISSKKTSKELAGYTKTKYGKFVYVSDRRGDISVYRKYKMFDDSPKSVKGDKMSSWEKLI